MRKKKNLKIFGPREDAEHNACLNYSHDPWDVYARGYIEAADILVKYIIAEQRSQDTLLYPIIYLYRHYIELRLKNILTDAKYLLDEDITTPGSHELYTLWQEVERRIRIIFDGDDVTPLKIVGDIIKEINDIDSKSEAFRYPIDKKGNKYLEGIKLINIVQFSEKMQDVIALLEGVACGTSEYVSDKAEMSQNIY